jgi:hypothetical protein
VNVLCWAATRRCRPSKVSSAPRWSDSSASRSGSLLFVGLTV